jgi:RNA-directed DNA polymerase
MKRQSALRESRLKRIPQPRRLLLTSSDGPKLVAARMFNMHIRGWINYYGRFYPSALYPTLRHIDILLARWADRKFKSLRRHKARVIHWLQRIARRATSLFAHWALLFGHGQTMGAV